MIRLLTLAVTVAALPAVAAAAIVIDQPQVRASIGQQKTSAAYMSVRNTGPDTDRLVSARCDCAESVSIHQTRTGGGVASMVPLKEVTVPARTVVAGVPDAWLAPDEPAARRAAYVDYLCRRLQAPRAFAQEAIRARL